MTLEMSLITIGALVIHLIFENTFPVLVFTSHTCIVTGHVAESN
jgi:hypothetical protein